MSIAFLILFIFISSYLIQIAKIQQSGYDPFVFATTQFCIFTHIILLIMSIWYCGWIFGIVLFALNFFGIPDVLFGWILTIPDMVISDEHTYLQHTRLKFACLTPVLFITLIFAVVSFFLTPFRSLYSYASGNTTFFIVLGIITFTSIVVRIVINKKYTGSANIFW